MDASPQDTLKPLWRSRALRPAWLILCLTLILVGAAVLYSRRHVNEQERQRFLRESSLLFEGVRLGQQAHLSRFTAAQLRLSAGEVTPETWGEVEQGTEWHALYPWLRQFGWADATAGSVVVRFLAGYGDRQPLRQGQELLQDAVFRDAIAMVATNHNRGISSPLRLAPVPGQEERLGVVLLFPVWEHSLTTAPDGVPRGYIVATVDPLGMFEMQSARTYRLLSTNSLPLLTPTNIVEVPRPGHTIAVRLLPAKPAPQSRPQDGLHAVRGDASLGRSLYFALSTTPAFDAETPRYFPLTVLWGGLATGLIFCLIAVNQAWHRAGAERLAIENARRAETLRASEERFRALIEHSFDIVMVLQPDGVLKYMSPAGRRLFSPAGQDELPTGGIPGVVHPDDLPLIIAAHQAVLENPGASRRVDCYRALTNTGETRFVEAIGTNCLGVPGVDGIVVNLHDITERKQAEDRLLELNRELEARVASRTADLTAANRELQAARDQLSAALVAERELHRLKSNFVSMVSHEVRTPMATILSSSGLLQDYADRLSPERRGALLQHIIDAAKQMAANMENVLLLSRMETAGFDPQPQRLALGELCRQLANEVDSATHRRCGIAVDVQGDAGREVLLDPSLFRHIFINLLTNAVKYSPPQSLVTFSLRREGDEAVLVVKDEGIGIPDADQTRLFQAFKRGSNSGGAPGTGIGLVIVKRSVELLRGHIAIVSKENEGTTVTVRLPLFAMPQPESNNP